MARAPVMRLVARIALALVAVVIAVSALSLFGYLSSLDRLYVSRDCPPEPSPPSPRAGRAIPGGGAVALAIGGDTSCTLMRDGQVWCWGDGALKRRFPASSGLAEPVDLPVPLMDRFLDQTKEIPRLLSHAPSGYVCAAFSSKVACWDAAHPSVVQPAPDAGTFVTLWTWEHSACAKADAGAVSCWGTGEPWLPAHESFSPIRIAGLDGADEVAACSSMVCARRGTSVECTRARDLQELRAATPDGGGHRIEVSALRISCCMDLACALTTGHDVACWSETFEPTVRPKGMSELGDGPLCGEHAADDALGGPEKKVAGGDTTCWLEDGAVRCTGVPAGNGVELDTATTHPLPGAPTAKDVLVDRVEWCLQSTEGTWTCWPRLQESVPPPLQAYGSTSRPPMAVADSEGSTAVAQGRFAICLTDREDHTHCRRRTFDGKTEPEIVLSGIDRLSIGDSHACALDRRGGLSCWGANESGQANGHRTASVLETPVHVMDDVADVAVGLRHTCAALRDGSIVCFGDNRYGQLGNGSTGPAPGIVRVAASQEPAARVAAGFDHTCALTRGGSVFCWGSDSSDRRVPPAVARVPTTVDGLAGPVKALAAGRDRSCAVLADASVACWGHEGWTDTTATGPQRVKGTESTVELGMGDDHVCVRGASGGVKCFGSNVVGQLATDLPWTRTATQPPKSCPSVTYSPALGSSSAIEVAW